MSVISLVDLPREIIYLVFEYLHQEHIVYSFFEFNYHFSFLVKHFIGKQLVIGKTNKEILFHYCLSIVLPSIGFHLQYLSITYPYSLLIYIKSIKSYCPNLKVLNICCCCSKNEDIRLYAAHFIHYQLPSLTFVFNGRIVGEEISFRLLNQSTNEQFPNVSIPSSSLVLHLSSIDDLVLLKRYSESSYLCNGLYMIECISTSEWLTDSPDDLCMTSKQFDRKHLFTIKQIDNDQVCLEYELYNEKSQSRLTVLICDEDEEYWISSSMLSTNRNESSRLCSTFTFEKIDNQNQFYIRPCYLRAKRLQVSGKRVIVSCCTKDNTPDHRFKLHRIAREHFF